MGHDYSDYYAEEKRQQAERSLKEYKFMQVHINTAAVAMITVDKDHLPERLKLTLETLQDMVTARIAVLTPLAEKEKPDGEAP